MSIEDSAKSLERATEKRRALGMVNMNALTLDEKEELAVWCAKADREIVLLRRELDSKINA